MIDSSAIALVLAIREHGSVSRAAAAAHMSVSAAYARISSLEAAMGGPVIHRGRGRGGLTELGRRCATWGERAQKAFDALPSERQDEPGTAIVRIGVLGDVLSDTGAVILEEWRARWPSVRPVLVPIDSHNQDTCLISGEVDVAFQQWLGDESSLGLVTHTTLTSSRAVVVPRWSDWADADALTPVDLADAEWLYTEGGSPRYRGWLDDLPISEASRDNVLTDPERIPRAVEVTGRVAVHSMAAQAYQTEHTRFVPLVGRPARLGVGKRAGEQPPPVETLYRLAVLCHNNLEALAEL